MGNFISKIINQETIKDTIEIYRGMNTINLPFSSEKLYLILVRISEEFIIKKNITAIKFQNSYSDIQNVNMTNNYIKLINKIETLTCINTLIYYMDHFIYYDYRNILLINLPNNINYLEINIFANTEEIYPKLNNLPINLKLLKINSIHFIPQLHLKKSYKLEIHNKKNICENDILLNPNIKLPYECKIELPNKTILDNTENFYIILKYIAPVFRKKKYYSKDSKKNSRKNSRKKRQKKY